MMLPKKKLLITFLIFAIIIAACFAFLFFPSALAVKNTLSQLKAQQDFLEEVDSRSVNLESLKTGWDESGGSLKNIDARLVKEDEVVDIVMILESLAEKVSISQEISVVRQSGSGEEILLKDNLTGDFDAIMKYVKGTENLKYLIEIDSCSFSKNPETIEAELMLRIPTYKK